jgi:putative membrane protein
MSTVAIALTALVAALHAGFMVLEMFLWNTPFGRRTFRLTEEKARDTAVLAANQGLYNGFLVAGLALALVGPVEYRYAFAVFTLTCVIVAGVYGAVTASRRILWVQALPAALALAAQVLAH